MAERERCIRVHIAIEPTPRLSVELSWCQDAVGDGGTATEYRAA
jgi:hypothetical protein